MKCDLGFQIEEPWVTVRNVDTFGHVRMQNGYRDNGKLNNPGNICHSNMYAEI